MSEAMIEDGELEAAGTGGETHKDDHPTGWRRWAYSTNHKDIGTMYLVLAILAGIVGGALSVAMRMELQSPGMQFFGDPEVFNVFVTTHGLVMIFFVIMMLIRPDKTVKEPEADDLDDSEMWTDCDEDDYYDEDYYDEPDWGWSSKPEQCDGCGRRDRKVKYLGDRRASFNVRNLS